MVVFHWFERGLGQLLAPDRNYEAQPDALDTQSDFWQLVAPDPNFVTKASHPHVQCHHCRQFTPVDHVVERPLLQTPSNSHTDTTTTTTTTTAAEALNPQTPAATASTAAIPSSSSTNTLLQSPPLSYYNATPTHNLQQLILQAVHETAHAVAHRSKTASLLFRWVASPTPINAKLQDKLRAKLQQTPDWPSFRSVQMACPNGYTLLMAAAHFNHVIAAEILLQAASPTTLDPRVDLQGQTPLHIAAHHGHVEFIRLWQTHQASSSIPQSVPPQDCLGRTPLGAAFLSPQSKQRQSEWKPQLYDANDPSLVGTHQPVVVPYSNVLATTAHMPGLRIVNEDALACHTIDSNQTLYCCVSDGHSDQGHIAQTIVRDWPLLWSQRSDDDDLTHRATQVCLELDRRVAHLPGGATAVTLLVQESQLVVVNVGDCRALLVQTDGVVVPLSQDHKPDRPSEQARIEQAGLTVTHEAFTDEDGVEQSIAKVQLNDTNRMAVSRSFGDVEYKTQIDPTHHAVVAVPELHIQPRDPSRDAFVVLACDGIWDVLSNHDVARFLWEYEQSSDLTLVAKALLEWCLEKGSTDNLSLVLVALEQSVERFQRAQALDYCES